MMLDCSLQASGIAGVDGKRVPALDSTPLSALHCVRLRKLPSMTRLCHRVERLSFLCESYACSIRLSESARRRAERAAIPIRSIGKPADRSEALNDRQIGP